MIKGFHFGQFIAGIAMFVYAMSLIETSLKNLAGRTFKKFLQKQTQNKLKSITAGTVVTAVLQSSSIVLLMVLSFVGAGLMNLRSALAVVLGSNLGTTLDSWVIATLGFKINFDAISFPILGISLIGLLLFRKNSKLYEATIFLIGFAFIFISLEWLKNCFENPAGTILEYFNRYHFLWFVPIGFVFTAIIQSSSVTVAILLSALYNNLIPFENAAAIIVGSELGTTLKFLISSIGGIPDKKRVAWGNFILNLVTMIFASLLIHPLIWFIQEIITIKDKLTGLVLFQTGINQISILIFFPILGPFAKLLEKLFNDPVSQSITKYIGKIKSKTSEDPLHIAEKETLHLIHHTINLNKNLLGINQNQKIGFKGNLIELVTNYYSLGETYNRKKILQGEIIEYITDIPKNDLTDTELERAGRIINITRHVIRSAKNIKDIHHNLEDFKQSANDNLFSFYENIKNTENEFYSEFQILLNLSSDKTNSALVENLNIKNRKLYEIFIENTINALKENKINELDSSNLLNVHHEIYSSNQSLIKALIDLIEIDSRE